MGKVKPGKYRHYKGNMYVVIGNAKHSDTLDDLVVYKALYGSKEFGEGMLWVKPAELFTDKVEIEGKTVPRFKYIGEE